MNKLLKLVIMGNNGNEIISKIVDLVYHGNLYYLSHNYSVGKIDNFQVYLNGKIYNCNYSTIKAVFIIKFLRKELSEFKERKEDTVSLWFRKTVNRRAARIIKKNGEGFLSQWENSYENKLCQNYEKCVKRIAKSFSQLKVCLVDLRIDPKLVLLLRTNTDILFSEVAEHIGVNPLEYVRQL